MRAEETEMRRLASFHRRPRRKAKPVRSDLGRSSPDLVYVRVAALKPMRLVNVTAREAKR